MGPPRPQPPSHMRFLMAPAVSSTLALMLQREGVREGPPGGDHSRAGSGSRRRRRRGAPCPCGAALWGCPRTGTPEWRSPQTPPPARGKGRASGVSAPRQRSPSPHPRSPLAARRVQCTASFAAEQRDGLQGRASFSGVISQFASQSQAPLPSDTDVLPPSPPTVAGDTSRSFMLAITEEEAPAMAIDCDVPKTTDGR